jgi:hypothetical protein
MSIGKARAAIEDLLGGIEEADAWLGHLCEHGWGEYGEATVSQAADLLRLQLERTRDVLSCLLEPARRIRVGRVIKHASGFSPSAFDAVLLEGEVALRCLDLAISSVKRRSRAWHYRPIDVQRNLARLRALTLQELAALNEQPVSSDQRTSHPAEPGGSILATLASAADLARAFGLSRPRTESALRRFRKKKPDCCTETDSPRKNEPRLLYRTPVVVPLLKALAERG